MAEPLVVFDGVWKKFRRGERHDSLRDLIPAAMRRVLGRTAVPTGLDDEEFWAVRDVSFAVGRGEAFGIVGPNGAGKSTTLKLLTRILKPTRGTCGIRGRVGALIEVAAGFHPDLTGRENIFLQGAIMGMGRAETAKKLDEIVEFAGVAPFLDTPVKRYSSGMNARLGFAIAAHLDPDVLVIDEVLSVGDMAFQERCITRMHEFKHRGVAIVFVSHNLHAVSMLCDRALFLRNEAIAMGPTQEVLDCYVSHAAKGERPADGDVVIESATLAAETGGPADRLAPGTPVVLRLDIASRADVGRVTFCFLVHRSTDLLPVYNGNFADEELGLEGLRAGDRLSLAIHFRANLLRGLYHVECIVLDTVRQKFLNAVAPLASFSVTETRTWAGVADLGVVVRAHRPDADDDPDAARPRRAAGAQAAQRAATT